MPQSKNIRDMTDEERLEELKRIYGVKTARGVIARALSLALAASKYADSDHKVTSH